MALRTAAALDRDIPRLRQAEALLKPTQAHLELARALLELDGALRRSGARADAREPLRRGLDLAYRCGATAVAPRRGRSCSPAERGRAGRHSPAWTR